MKQAYSIPEVADLVGITTEVTRALVALVFGEQRDLLSLNDLVLVREAYGLWERKIKKTRITQTLAKVRAELPSEHPLSAVTLQREGQEIVIGHGPRKWNAESGQGLLDFTGRSARTTWLRPIPRRDAEALFTRAAALEESSPDDALEAYTEAIAANPHHADAHVNLGRLLHQRGHLREAEAHYVAALVARPTDVTAIFNLAVVLEDLGRGDDAIARYQEAIELDPGCVDAYFNLSKLYEKKGEKLAAIRHLKDYKRLVDH